MRAQTRPRRSPVSSVPTHPPRRPGNHPHHLGGGVSVWGESRVEVATALGSRAVEPIRVVVRRGGTVESVHRVQAALVRGGEVVDARGDPQLVTFLRSSAKPIQALQLVRARPDLDNRLLAIACASHRAEPAQIEAVRDLLAAGGVSEDDLEVGLQEGRPPEPIYHNCSGKHAGMLAVCRARGWPTQGYRLPEHPLQQEILAEVTDAAGQAPATGTDHCSVVTFALPLERMAAVFSRLDKREGGDRILAAMRAH